MTGQRSAGGLVEQDSADQPTTDPMALAAIGEGVDKDLAFIWRWILLAGAAGAWAGLLIGGVGGRVAMFVLRTTSDDSVRGIDSDDGFTIGQFTAATGFLLGITTIIGLLMGLVVVLARSQLRGRSGWTLIVLAGGTLGAAKIIKPHGVDFNRLAPQSLACAMFTFIPLAATALTLWFVSRWRVWWWRDRRRTSIAMLPWTLGLLAFFVTIPALTVALIVGVGSLRIRLLRRVLTNRAGLAVATLITIVLIVWSASELISDISEIVS